MTRTILALAAFQLFGPSFGQDYHVPPPPMNVIGAGYNMEYAAKVRHEAEMSLRMAGDTRNTAAPWIMGGVTCAAVFSLNLHSAKWENRAGDLWQCGYSPTTLYESIPDSIGPGELKRYRIPRMIDGNKVHMPARFR